MTARTTKITTGLYQLTYQGRVFQIEDHYQASDGQSAPGWMAYEMTGPDFDRREYLNDYVTKRSAIANTIAAVDEGY
jgi:hypothetical protein